MALKLDMIKSYDHVGWKILRASLNKMVFARKTVNLLMARVTLAMYRISHVGIEFGHIFQDRGLHQRDTLSSYLFLLCTEGFTSLIMRI